MTVRSHQNNENSWKIINRTILARIPALLMGAAGPKCIAQWSRACGLRLCFLRGNQSPRKEEAGRSFSRKTGLRPPRGRPAGVAAGIAITLQMLWKCLPIIL